MLLCSCYRFRPTRWTSSGNTAWKQWRAHKAGGRKAADSVSEREEELERVAASEVARAATALVGIVFS